MNTVLMLFLLCFWCGPISPELKELLETRPVSEHPAAAEAPASAPAPAAFPAVQGSYSGHDPAEIENLFQSASRAANIPAELVKAIAAVESDMHPWAVNVAGRGYFCKTKVEALSIAREARRSGRSFDVGLMQVNNWWLKRRGVSLEDALEPSVNIPLGVWILKQEIDRLGSVRAAVGAYHSPNPRRASRYADKVMRAVQPEAGGKAAVKTRREPSDGVVAETTPPAAKPASMKMPEWAITDSMKVKKK